MVVGVRNNVVNYKLVHMVTSEQVVTHVSRMKRFHRRPNSAVAQQDIGDSRQIGGILVEGQEVPRSEKRGLSC